MLGSQRRFLFFTSTLSLLFSAARAQFFQAGFKTGNIWGMSGLIEVPQWNIPTKDVYIYAALQATHYTTTTVDDQLLQPAIYSVAPNRNVWRTSTYLMKNKPDDKNAAGKVMDLTPGSRMIFNMQRINGTNPPEAKWKMALRSNTKMASYEIYTMLNHMQEALFTIEVYNGSFTPDMAPIVFRGLQIWSADDDGKWCSDDNLYRSYARAAVRNITLENGKDFKTCHIESLKLSPLEHAPPKARSATSSVR